MEMLSDTKGSGCGTPPCPMVHPWLVFPYGKNRKFQVFVDPLDPSNRAYRKKIPEMRYHSYLQPPSGEGWLIMSAYEEKDSRSSKYSDCFLWKPKTSEKIQLPSHFHWMNKYSLHGCVLYSPPSHNNIYDSIVYFLFFYGEEDKESFYSYFLLYCHPGDKQWRKQNLPSSFERHDLSGLVCLKGKLYVVSSTAHSLFEVEMETQQNGDKTVLKITPFCKKEAMRWLGMLSSPLRCSQTNIVESQDEVFKVTRHYYHPYVHVKQIFELEVFRMDFSSMAWKELRSLGDHVLFLDVEGNTCVPCSAIELGLPRGCIFFIQDNDKTLYKFDIEDGSIEFSLPCPNLPTPWLSPSWMTIGKQQTTTTTTNDVIIKAEEERTSNINNNGGKEIITKSSGRRELEEESRDTSWESLNQNILELISGYLPLLDYFHFRAVCKENRLATTRKMKHMQCASLSPWLIILKAKDGVYNLAEPIYNDKFFINVSGTFTDATIRYSKGGWLLMTKGISRTIFFYNPFTRAIIHLPDIPDDFPVHNLSGMSFSSLPTSSDCVVMGIAADWGFNEVWALSIVRGDDYWNYGDVENTIYLPSEELNVDFVPWRNNPVFYKEAFYCLDFNGKLGVSDARDGTWEILDLHGPCDSIKQSFLVECEGKLLAVFISHTRTCVKVFRLDMDKKLWITVESLGKYVLFISNTSSLSAVAPSSRMENKIYFPRFHGEDIVYYSLDTCQYHTFGSQQYSGLGFYNTKEQLYCSWIEPNWSSTTAEELVWCSPVTEEVDE